jgi:hypothetical protein
VSESILAGIEQIEDPEVRTGVQTKLDQELDYHYRDMLTYKSGKEIEAFEKEYSQAAEQAVRTGDVEVIEWPLQQLVEAGFYSDEQAQAAFDATQAKTQVWQTALAKGWKEGLKYATDPETMVNLPLSQEERQAFKSELERYLQTEKTLEELDQRKELARIEQTKNHLFADAMADQLDDPTQIDAALRSGVVSPAEAKQLQELVKKGPPTENDPDALIEINRMIDGIERGDVQPQQVIAQINKNASRLTPAKRDSLIERATNVFGFQNRAMTDTRRYAITQLVTVNESMLERLYAMGTGTDVLKPIEDRRAFEYRLVEYVQDQVGDWIRDHPDATPDDVQVQGRRLIHQVRDIEHAERQTLLDAWEQQGLTPAATPWEGPNEGVLPLGTVSPQGLESVWDTMTTEEKQTALNALANGTATAEQIREMLR